jgi:thiol:disulfide interchange protein DsbD
LSISRANFFWLAAACILQVVCSDAFAARELKKPAEVFRFDARMESGEIVVDWDIEDGYYLYRERMQYSLVDGGLGSPVFPDGEVHSDEFFGEQIIFRNRIQVRIPVQELPQGQAELTLKIRSQGCADYGLCYPPQDWEAKLERPAGEKSASPLRSSGLTSLAASAGASLTGDPLPQSQAFIPSISTPDPFTLEVRWDIEPGYYLYRDSFTFANPDEQIQLGKPQLPQGVMEMDAEFGETEVYYDVVVIRIPLSRSSPDPLVIELAMDYQGCKKDSICYPPASITLPVDLPRATSAAPARVPPVSEQDRLSAVISSAGLPTIMLVFVGLGLLLAFTPCCLPMVPILSGIIAGQGNEATTARSFWLSVSYVLGMAFTYTLAGALFGAAGGQIQAALQTPEIISAVALLFVVLSLAMFGVYELQLPAALQTRLSALGSRGKSGSFIGTGILGAISALIVSTCVAPPLVAALTVIAQTGDVARGALALFALSIGMGIPLIIYGTSAGKLLPKSGPWMNTVKGIFGLMLLGLAIWMLDRILPSGLIMFLWSALAIFAGIWGGALRSPPNPTNPLSVFSKLTGIVLLGYGGLLLIGAFSGASDPFNPLEKLAGDSVRHEQDLPFVRIKSVEDFDAALANAAADNQPLMLDFYADWCVSCKEMEAWTFTDERVQDALGEAVLLQADVTANDAVDQALLQRFGIFGPPTIVFFDRAGEEIQGQRVIGYMSADDFLAHLDYVLQ